MTTSNHSETSGGREATEASRCANCDYSLMGLGWDARCPECGCDVAISRLPDGVMLTSKRGAKGIQLSLSLFVVDFLMLVIRRIGMVGVVYMQGDVNAPWHGKAFYFFYWLNMTRSIVRAIATLFLAAALLKYAVRPGRKAAIALLTLITLHGLDIISRHAIQLNPTSFMTNNWAFGWGLCKSALQSALAVAVVIAGFSLAGVFDKRRQTGARRAAVILASTASVLFIGALMGSAASAGQFIFLRQVAKATGPMSWSWSSLDLTPFWNRWQEVLTNLREVGIFWDNHVSDVLHIIQVLAIWYLLRQLRTAVTARPSPGGPVSDAPSSLPPSTTAQT